MSKILNDVIIPNTNTIIYNQHYKYSNLILET